MPNAEATAAITAAAIRRSEARTSPLPRQTTPKPANGFRGCMVRSTPLSSQRELLVSIGSTRLSHCPVRFRSPSGHRTTPLVIGALACHLAINSSLGLLLRNTGGDLGLLPIDTAKADIAIGPCWPSRKRLAISPTYRRCRKRR